MKQYTFTTLTFLLLFSACDDSGDCLNSYGETITETHVLSSGIKRIHIDDDIDVNVVFDSAAEISVTYGNHIIDNIRIVESENLLKLSNETQCIWNKKPDQHPFVEIRIPSLRYIRHNGYGMLEFHDTLSTEEFTLDCFNSAADIKLLLHTRFSAFKIHSGPAKVEAYGRSETLNTYHSASGMIFAHNFAAGEVYSFSDGKGDTYIYAKNKLKASIHSFGNIYFRGDPGINQTINGEGQLLPMDYSP